MLPCFVSRLSSTGEEKKRKQYLISRATDHGHLNMHINSSLTYSGPTVPLWVDWLRESNKFQTQQGELSR